MTKPEQRDPDQFAIIPIYSDSLGARAVPSDALFVGSRSAVMERIVDSKARRDALTLINDADRVRRDRQALKADQAAFKADQAAFAGAVESVQDALIGQFTAKVDALAARMDAIEQERSRDPDDDLLPSPPGTVIGGGSSTGDDSADDGNLQAPIAAKDPDPDTPRTPVAEEDQSHVGGLS
jgi:hypothetical protein